MSELEIIRIENSNKGLRYLKVVFAHFVCFILPSTFLLEPPTKCEQNCREDKNSLCAINALFLQNFPFFSYLGIYTPNKLWDLLLAAGMENPHSMLDVSHLKFICTLFKLYTNYQSNNI